MRPNTEVYDKLHRLYPEAHEATKATQDTKGSSSRFRKRLKSVNHLNHDGSKIIHQPLARIAEALLEVWLSIKKAWSGLMKRLFPRKHVIYGTNMDSSLVGQLTFSHRDDAHVPIHHMRLEFWARTKFGKWKLLSTGFTEEDGTFELPFDMMAVHGYDIRKLWFEMYHTDSYKFDGHRAKPVHELWHKFKVKKGDLTGMSYDLGMIQLDYWEYRTDTPLPRVCINDHDHDPPEKYAPGRVGAIEKQFIPIELTTKKHLLEIDAGSNLTIDKIQADYPENLTVCMDSAAGFNITRSDEWFGMRFMNGMFASTFDRDPDDPSLYWIYYHWRTYADPDSIYAMPDVSIKFKMQDNGYLLPVEISLKGKLRESGDPNEKVTLTPADGDKWESAKRVARVSGAIATEVDRHFAETHTNVEQMAIAARRNVRRNPIGALLFPHLKEVSLINHTADQILINDTGYIAEATALKKEGLQKRVNDVMGTLDWKGWVPMKPLSDKHLYAKAANLFHEVTTKYVEEFIELHKDEIIEEWHEVFSMSNDLVKHSVPVFMCSYIRSKLKPDGNEMVTPSPANAWYTRENRMDLNIQRTDFTINESLERGWLTTLGSHEDENKPSGIKRAFSPITANSHFNEGSGDLERLKSYCAYSIFQATFGHYWSNSRQYDDIGEIKYSSLGIRLGTPENGILGPEDDPAVSPDLKISTQMMWWSNMLSRTGYGFITKNEEGDISPRFIELLEEQREAFAKLDLDIDDIQSRTNI